jgi:hypothetical protein
MSLEPGLAAATDRFQLPAPDYKNNLGDDQWQITPKLQ